MTSTLRALVLLTPYLQAVAGLPVVSFPFNAQLPPVARIGRLYTYSLPSHTFQSEFNITYSLGDHPSWLSLESDEPRLYGIPEDEGVPAGKVVGQHVQIIATDEMGSTTMDATMVISRDQGPAIKIPLSDQIEEFGAYSAPSSILSYPDTDFEYTFDQNTFHHAAGRVSYYYAVSGQNSPLPAWLRFDAASLTFSGKTPAADALSQPPQTFDIRLVASDIEGFSSISIDFSIVVGSHKLTTENPVIELNASRGSHIEYDGLVGEIKLDNEPVHPGDLSVATTNLPEWLSFDPNTWAIQGTPGKSDHSTNFTLRFTDPFLDALDVRAMINVATGLFETTFHNIETTPGENFSLDIASHVKDPSDIKAKFHTEPKQNWLKLDGLEIKGKVPKSASGELTIVIEVWSLSSGQKETETLAMTFLALDGKTTTTPTTTTSTPSETARHSDDTEGDKDAAKEGEGGISTSTILLATVIPILAVALFIMLLVCFVRRRRNRRAYLSKKLRNNISRPVLGSLHVNGSSRQGSRSGGSENAESPAVRGEKGRCMHADSHPSSPSSDTLGSLSSPDMSQACMHNAGPRAITTPGDAGTEDGRASWYTIDTIPAAQLSQTSTRSPGSGVITPPPTHQLLPMPLFLSQPLGSEDGFRSAMDLTLPSLDGLPSIQHTPDASYLRPGRSTAMYSSITTSSAALPLSRPGSAMSNPRPISPAINAAASPKRSEMSSSDRDWSTISEDESYVPELPPSSLSRLSNIQWLNRRTGDSFWTGRDSFVSDTSFCSSENWRVIGAQGRSAPNLSLYKEMVEGDPFHPARPSIPPMAREGAKPGERPNSPAATVTGVTGEGSRKWEGPEASLSRLSKLYEEAKSSGWSAWSTNWRREYSG